MVKRTQSAQGQIPRVTVQPFGTMSATGKLKDKKAGPSSIASKRSTSKLLVPESVLNPQALRTAQAS